MINSLLLEITSASVDWAGLSLRRVEYLARAGVAAWAFVSIEWAGGTVCAAAGKT